MIDLEGRVSAEENAAVRAIGNPEAEELARIFARLPHEGALKENIDTLFMGMKGRGGEALCKHLSGTACVVFQ